MPQSFVCLHVHLVFSTKNRVPMIDEEIAARLYDYIGGIIRNRNGSLIAAAGMPDHVHLLISLGKEMSISELVRVIKSNSSKWIHETFPRHQQFRWQSGYGAFAVSQSNFETVKGYIAGQAEHHHTHSFQDELRALLKRCNIEFDERYMWD